MLPAQHDKEPGSFILSTSNKSHWFMSSIACLTTPTHCFCVWERMKRTICVEKFFVFFPLSSQRRLTKKKKKGQNKRTTNKNKVRVRRLRACVHYVKVMCVCVCMCKISDVEYTQRTWVLKVGMTEQWVQPLCPKCTALCLFHYLLPHCVCVSS